MPRAFRPGRNGALLLWGKRGVTFLAQYALCNSIFISISSLNEMNVQRTNPINVPGARLEGKRASFAPLHPPHMDARCFECGRDDGPHPVARLQAADVLLPHLIPTRKSFLRPVGSTMLAPSAGLDRKRCELARPDACQIPHAQGITCMTLLDSEPRPVPPGPPARPAPERQATTAQGLDNLGPCRVDCCRVLEGAFGLRLHLRMAELHGRLVPLGRVAVVTGQSQIRDAVGASSTAWQDVVELERAVGLPAIGTPIRVLDEQIRPALPSRTRALLILGAADLRVLQELGVEADTLHLDAAHGRPAGQPVRAGDGIAHPGEQRRRQPPSGNPPACEARPSLPQAAVAAADL